MTYLLSSEMYISKTAAKTNIKIYIDERLPEIREVSGWVKRNYKRIMGYSRYTEEEYSYLIVQSLPHK